MINLSLIIDELFCLPRGQLQIIPFMAMPATTAYVREN